MKVYSSQVKGTKATRIKGYFKTEAGNIYQKTSRATSKKTTQKEANKDGWVLVHQREKIQKAFNLYDSNDDNSISIDELQRGYDAVGKKNAEKAALKALREHDSDNDGKLSFEEFETWSLQTNAVDYWEKTNAIDTWTKIKENNMSIVPSGELSEMLMNLSDDWATSDDELNFAEDSDNENEEKTMAFAGSSSGHVDNMVFAETSDSMSPNLEFAESSEFAMTSDSDTGQ
jgi:hypothetical protein